MKSYTRFIENYAVYNNTSGDSFWGDVAGGVLPICSTTKRILLNYRSKYVNEPNTWGIWGGKLDSDENIIDTVKREFLEESGYDEEIDLIPAYVFRSKKASFEYHNFIGILEKEFTPELDWESSSYLWVTFDELINIKPKHFGLVNLLQDEQSLQTIKNNIKI